MQLEVSFGIVLFLFVLVWVLISRVALPKLRKKLNSTSALGLVGVGHKLVVFGVIRDIALAGAIAPIAIISSVLSVNYFVSHLAESQDSLVDLMKLRQMVEPTLQFFQTTSLFMWISALGIIGVIWVVVSGNKERDKWEDAIEARRLALTSSLKDKSQEELKEYFAEFDSEALGLGAAVRCKTHQGRQRAESCSQLNCAQFIRFLN